MADELTQLEHAKNAVREICAVVDEQMPTLKWAIDIAQNDPPEGASDGSIDSITFSYLQTMRLALERVLHARAQLRSLATGEPAPPMRRGMSDSELQETVTPAYGILDDDIPY